MSGRKSSSNTFTISVVEDGYSVVAQYSPDKVVIHTTFQTGDIYMRTKSTKDGATWSQWQKVVGENGNETSYTFNISQKKTSTNAATPPSDCYYNTWQDAPVVATQQYPYLWMKVVKKTWNASTQSYDDGTPSYVRVTGEESVTYYIKGALPSIKMKAGEYSTAVRCVYSFYKKAAVNSEEESITCYYAVYLRSGTTFSLLTMASGYSNHGNGSSVDVRATVPYSSGNTVYDAMVIYTFATEYYSTNPEGQSYLARLEVLINKDGENSFVVDLDNEMTGIAVDKDGKTKAVVSLTPQVRAFYGASDVIGDCTVTTSSSDANVSATYSTSTHKVTVSANSGVTLSAATTITITVTHSTYAPNGRSVKFVLSAVREGANAFIQELIPDPNEVSFARLADGSLTPPSRDLSLSIKKTDGSSTTEQTIAQSGLIVRWGTTMPATKTNGTEWGYNPATPIDGITWNNEHTVMQIASSVGVTNICIAAFKSDGTLVDKETIPIIKDGQHGDGAPAAYADPEKITIPCNYNGSVKAQLTTNVTFSMAVGEHKSWSNPSEVTITSVTCNSHPTGVLVASVSTGVMSITVPTSQNANGIRTGCTFTVTGTYDGKSYSAKVTVALEGTTQGPKGDDSYAADLDNEMDSVPCDSSGNTIQEQLLYTNVSFYKGTTSLLPFTSIVCSVDGTTLSTDYVDETSPRQMFKATVDATDGSVVIGVKGGKPLTKETVDIAVTADGQTRNLSFVINGVKGGKDAIIYSLVPNSNEIIKHKDNSTTPASDTYLTCAVMKRIGNSNPVTAPTSEYTLKYSKDGGTETVYPTNPAGILVSSISSNVVFILYDKAGTPNVLDRETIGVVKDGYDAPVAVVSPADTFTIQCNNNGSVAEATNIDVTLSLKVGTNSANVTSVSWGTLPTGVTIESLYTNAFRIKISTSATASGLKNGVTFTVNGKYPNNSTGNTYSANVTVALIGSIEGEQGARGKTGRFFYYAGEFNSGDSSKTFEVNDAQAPFFKTGQNYHVFNYSVNGSYTMAQMWNLTEESGNPPAKSFNNYPWESMTNDFKYLITEAIFGEYAHFGASIINGDFMMSQFGYVRGFNGVKQDVADDETYYTNFNSKQPFGTEDLYDSYTSPSQWLISNTVSKYEIESTSYSQLYNYAFNLKSGLWYTIEIDGYCDDNGSLKFMLAKNSSDTPVANGSISGYTNDNTYFPAYVTFKATSDIKNCKIFVMKTQGNAEIKGVYLRKAQFVPHFVVDLRSGEMSADKLNGKLRAKYFDYGVAKSLSTQNIVVGDNSVACLTNQASCAVILPNPAQAEGRIIEVYSASSDWTVMWEGAGVSDNFKLATNSTNNNYRTWWRADGSNTLGTSISYLKLWSDGTVWWVLNKIIIDNNNINN